MLIERVAAYTQEVIMEKENRTVIEHQTPGTYCAIAEVVIKSA